MSYDVSQKCTKLWLDNLKPFCYLTMFLKKTQSLNLEREKNQNYFPRSDWIKIQLQAIKPLNLCM